MIPPKDIVFFLCLNDKGGAEISMLRLAEGLRKAGRGVRLAVYGARPDLARELGFGGEIIDLKCRRTLESFFPLVALLRSRRAAYIVSALTHGNLVALAAGCLTGARTVVTEHGLDGVDACGSSRLFGCLVRFLYKRAYAVVAVSKALAERWRMALPAGTKITAIYNPVIDPDAVSPAPAHEWLRSKTMPVVIGIGRLKPEKNFALLIRAFAAALKEKPMRLIILGEGDQRAMLENMAGDLGVGDHILMPGFVDEVRGWVAHADLLVCPSRREGFGNVIVEALACGVPVVATDCAYGPAEILQQGRYGRLVPPDDAAAMSGAILAALESVPDKPAMAARGALFTAQACIDAYADLLDNAASR